MKTAGSRGSAPYTAVVDFITSFFTVSAFWHAANSCMAPMTLSSFIAVRPPTRVGVVTSAKQAHTVAVVVERMREHPLYKKVIRLRKKYAAHDAAGDVRAGDLVRIQESRPFSATKHWQVVEVLSRAGEAGAAAPRAEDVEKLLEQAEGVDEILVPRREEKPEPVAEETAE